MENASRQGKGREEAMTISDQQVYAAVQFSSVSFVSSSHPICAGAPAAVTTWFFLAFPDTF
jgi:hypothetical protein